MKVIRSEDSVMFDHMETEFQILQRLQAHKNIVNTYQYIPEKFNYRGYLVMELVTGESLLKRISTGNNTPFDEKTGREVVKQLMEGVKFMHERGVVHRDLNPSNIFINEGTGTDSEYQVKIIDFNVSKLLKMSGVGDDFGSDMAHRKEEDEEVYKQSKFKYLMLTKTGTPIFTAPEMHYTSLYSESVDIWGIGIIMFYSLVGYPPFYEKS